MAFDLESIKFVTLPTFLAYTAGSVLSGRCTWPPIDFLATLKPMCQMKYLQHFFFALVICVAASIVEKEVSRAFVCYGQNKLWSLSTAALTVVACMTSVVFRNAGNVLADTARVILSIYVGMKLISFVDFRNRLRWNAGDLTPFLEGTTVQTFWPLIGPWMSYRPSRGVGKMLRVRVFVRAIAVSMICPYAVKVLLSGWALPLVKRQSHAMPVKHLTRTLLLTHPTVYIVGCLFLLIFEGVNVFFGELSGTTDTIYYSDWYNASTPRGFWQKWNIPVHRFLTRYTYVPAIKRGVSKFVAAEISFLVSALLHEYVMYIALGPRPFMFTVVLLFQPLVFGPSELVDRYSKFASHCLLKSFVLWSWSSLLVAYQ